MKNTLLQSLTRRSEFKKVFDQGRKFPSQHLILYVQSNCLDRCRLGLVVSRKVGNAVTRNRVRRRIREIFRELMPAHPVYCDIVVVARSTAPQAEFRELVRSIRRVLAGLMHEKIVHSDDKTL